MSTTVAAVRGEFAAEVTFLNTATIGLPPRRTLAALQRCLDEWRTGRSDPHDFDGVVAAARSSYAALVGVETAWVAVGSQASVHAGLVAASVPEGAEVLVAQGDFTSVVFPFLAQERRGVVIREVPLERLIESIGPQTRYVAVSAVQSGDGRVIDLDGLADTADAVGAAVMLDVTQAAGWLPVDAGRFAFTVCSGYKWLLAPRGTTFFTARPERWDGVTPHAAGWYAGADVWTSIYGSPLRLAEDARRFDISPAWHSWAGQLASLELLTEVGISSMHQHAVALANDFRAAVDLPPGDSAIVSLAFAPDGRENPLAAAGIAASLRAGRLRLSFHVNNDSDDVGRAAEVVGPMLQPEK